MPLICQVLCLLIKNRIILCEWNKYCPWAYCEHWCRFSLQFCATWKLLIPCFQQFEQCIPRIIQRKGQFGSCTVASGETPCPPHVQHQLCPRTRALWPHSHSSRLAAGVEGRIRSWVHTEGLKNSGGSNCLAQACSLILESQKNQLHILLLNSSCHYSLCMVLSHEITEHEQLSVLFIHPCVPNNQLLLLQCLWQKGRSIKRYPILKRYFQDFDSVFWGAQKSTNLTKKFHSLISSSSQDIIAISLLQKQGEKRCKLNTEVL